MADLSCDVVIVGGGPGGYVCAIRGAQLGLDVVLIDRDGLGGTCLNVGCIPSKALIHVANEFHQLVEAADGSSTGLSCSSPSVDFGQTQAWKDGIVARLTGGVSNLLKRAGVRVLAGKAGFLDGKTVEVVLPDGPQRVTAEAVVVATGSVPVGLPNLPIGGKVIGSTEALSLADIPDRLVIVGAGYIGLELGTAFAKLGAKIDVVEAGDAILPSYDRSLVGPVSSRLEALGVSFYLGRRVEGLTQHGAARLDDGTELPCDHVLVTVGRTANTTGFGLEALDLEMDGPFIRIDDRCRTSMRGVFAIGDVTGEPLLAHRAMAQGEMVAELLAGRVRHWDDRVIPSICFTDPEIVSVGLSPSAARAMSGEVVEASFPFIANGRAMTLERDDGLIRVVARKGDHTLLGVQAVGAGVSELASSFVGALEMGARLEDIGTIVQAHPTLAEAFQEAALKAVGHAIHV